MKRFFGDKKEAERLRREAEEAEEQDRLRDRITRFYQKYNPEKLGDVDGLVKEHFKKEHKLFAALTKKYGPEPLRQELYDVTNAIRKPDQIFENRDPSWVQKVEHRVFGMEVLPGGRMVLGGDPSGMLQVLNPVTGVVEKKAEGHIDTVLSIELGPQGIFTGSADHTVKLFDGRTYEVLQSYEEHDGMVMALTVCAAAGVQGLFSASDDLKVIQWNIDNGSSVYTYKDFDEPINCLTCSTTHVFAGSHDGIIYCLEVVKKMVVNKILAHEGGVWSLAIDPDGVLFSGGGDGHISVWSEPLDAGKKNIIQPASSVTAHEGAVKKLLYYEDTVFSAGNDTNVCVWNFEPEKNELALQQVLRSYTALGGGQCQRALTALGLANNEVISTGLDKVINRWHVADLLVEEMDIVPLPPIDQRADDEHERRLMELHPRDRHEYYATLDVNTAVKKYTDLPINYLIDSLQFKVEASWLTNELICFIPFFIMFLFFFLQDYSAKDLYYMNLATTRMTDTQTLYRFKTERNFFTVTNLDWYEQWATAVLIPGLWGDKGATSWHEAIRFNGQNLLVGSLRIRTQRVKAGSCDTDEDIIPSDVWNTTITRRGEYTGCFGKLERNSGGSTDAFACEFGNNTCVQAGNCTDTKKYTCTHDAAEVRSRFGFDSGYFEYSPNKGTRYNGIMTLYGKGGFVVDIPAVLSQDDAITMFRRLISNGFVDRVATRFISVEFFQYNPEINFFISNKLVIEVAPGGAFMATVQHKPFRVFDYETNVGRTIYDCFFFAYVLFWVYNYFSEMRSHYKLYGAVLGYVVDTWNLVELVNIGLFIAMFVIRWQWMHDSQFSRNELPFDARVFPENLDNIVDQYQYQVYINAFNTVLTTLKILKFATLNDQLNILTKALAAAQSSIIGVLLLFVYFVFAFAITGMSMYGENIYGYRTLDASYNTMMRMLVGDFDYDAMSMIHRPATVVFFWAFLIFANFLLLNFLIAVLSDAFQDVCDGRLPLPIDKAIIRAAERIKEQLLPRALRITFLLLTQRHTRTELTAKHARYLRKYRESIVSEEAVHFKDWDECEHTYIAREFFLEKVPPELRTEDNLNFMDEVWYDMAWEWHWHLQDKHRQNEHEHAEVVGDVINAEFATMLRRANDTADTIAALKLLEQKMAAINGLRTGAIPRTQSARVRRKLKKGAMAVLGAVTSKAKKAAAAVDGLAKKD